ncbi:MAG TPA: hypothetical protein VFQ53_14920 [Kofleriaceae bacterium]|nr:hypothetical protein [Kofleriaceae bacterium]
MSKPKENTAEAEASADATTDAPAEKDTGPKLLGGPNRKRLIWVGVITALVWAFTIQTGSRILMIVVGVLTVLLIGVILWAFRMTRKQQRVVDLLKGSQASPEARKTALAELDARKDASSPTNLFARAQLMAPDDPAGALKLLNSVELKQFHPQMQDDVSLLKMQLCIGLGRTADARKHADTINLDNPSRAEMRPMAGSMVAEVWARTGKSKDALALLETIVPKGEGKEQIAIQCGVARVFARFAAGQRQAARKELVALADDDPNHLARFVLPQFKVHPELQKLARSVLNQHPAARAKMKVQAR